MKWTKTDVTELVEHSPTSMKYYRYKESFFKWYKQQDTASFDAWKEQNLHLLDLCEEIEDFSCYGTYHSQVLENSMDRSARCAELHFLWPGFIFSLEDKCRMTKFALHIASTRDVIRKLNWLQTDGVSWLPAEVFENEIQRYQNRLAGLLEEAKSFANPIDCALLGELYNKYDNFVPSKQKRGKYEKIKEGIKNLYEHVQSLQNYKTDIYQHARRLPGSAFSKQ